MNGEKAAASGRRGRSVLLGFLGFLVALVALVLINGYIIWAPLAALAVKLGLLKSPADANI